MDSQFLKSSWVFIKGQLKSHTCLWPLVGSCVAAGSLCAGALIWAGRKDEVRFYRRRVIHPHESVAWDRADQKVFVLTKEAKSLYKDDPELRGLLKEIYEDGRYDRVSPFGRHH
ncbi:unnamed protein product [Clavelina lepadiformis]|uniref:Cytochrome b5 heme-binding domain-containing protein n=1 Tax=Clavelina lepadiformis TaxID=159417 RepID=A0ABP0H3M4_CLALP